MEKLPSQESVHGEIKEAVFKGSKERIEQDLDKVDFGVLRDVFEDVYKKCGLDLNKMKFVLQIQYFFYYTKRI
jgi:hypothetical protein